MPSVPVGLVIKPVTVLAALNAGMSLTDPVNDQPITLTPGQAKPVTEKFRRLYLRQAPHISPLVVR